MWVLFWKVGNNYYNIMQWLIEICISSCSSIKWLDYSRIKGDLYQWSIVYTSMWQGPHLWSYPLSILFYITQWPLVSHCVYRDARNMARDVHNTLIKIVQEHGQMDNTAATEFIKKLQKRGRYLQDVWS